MFSGKRKTNAKKLMPIKQTKRSQNSEKRNDSTEEWLLLIRLLVLYLSDNQSLTVFPFTIIK